MGMLHQLILNLLVIAVPRGDSVMTTSLPTSSAVDFAHSQSPISIFFKEKLIDIFH
jgi:hypothetical protein